ncbi:MAG: PDZ domain-containing protein [Chloroflexi bacterium]|nr:PDZ domain-containing protein [Chloroflexota bacterium]
MRSETAARAGLTALVAAALLWSGGCANRLTTANQRGDPEAAARADAIQARRQAAQASQDNPRPVSPLTDEDIANVYRAVLTNYVESVDYAGLIFAGANAVDQSIDAAGYPPLAAAPIEIFPVPTGSPERDFQSFIQAFDSVKNKMPDYATSARPDYAVVRAMMASLNDPQSTFIAADDTRRRADGGGTIGIIMIPYQETGNPMIVEVIPNSPAAQAGLRPGDQIVRVNSETVTSAPADRIASLIRGQVGTEVELEVSRQGSPVVVRAFRRAIDVPPAELAVDSSGIGLLRVRSLSDQTVVERVGALLAGSRSTLKSLVLDLRRVGGTTDIAKKVAGYFMDVRPLAISTDRSGQRTAEFTDQRPASSRVNVPMVVLVDGQTSGAGELLAAALRDYQIATLVGAKTAGSVGVVGVQQLSDGSAVALTLKHLLAPSGTAIDRVGLQPDIPIENTVDDLANGRDPQRDRARQVLALRSS